MAPLVGEPATGFSFKKKRFEFLPIERSCLSGKPSGAKATSHVINAISQNPDKEKVDAVIEKLIEIV